jgi:hypothetical protein
MPATINANDIPPAVARKLGMPRPKANGFSKEQVRSWAIRLLAEVAGLTQEQRRRVLDFAARLNRL